MLVDSELERHNKKFCGLYFEGPQYIYGINPFILCIIDIIDTQSEKPYWVKKETENLPTLKYLINEYLFIRLQC